MTRRIRTAKERAEEALGVAERRVKRLSDQRDKLQHELAAIERDLNAAHTRLNYAKADPALTPPPTEESTE